MKMRLGLIVTAAVLAASIAAAQGRTQRELVLLAQPAQQVSINAMAEILRPDGTADGFCDGIVYWFRVRSDSTGTTAPYPASD